MNPEFDAIIVGAGLAGLTCAHQLATQGLNVVVVERGKFAGAKNMWGGAFYGSMMGDFIPHFWKEAPIERYLVQHTISFLSKDRCFSTSLATFVSRSNLPVIKAMKEISTYSRAKG